MSVMAKLDMLKIDRASPPHLHHYAIKIMKLLAILELWSRMCEYGGGRRDWNQLTI
jgi:hypothetical protein